MICQRLQQFNHPDVLWVEPSCLHQGKLLTNQEAAELGIKKKAPPQIRIEQIRQISQFLAKPPMLGEQSLVVIDQAQTMPEGAANALLKTLEEPGKATIILIAPTVESLLPTLVSRCQKISFFRLSDEALNQVLINLNYLEIKDNKSILGIAQGSPGQAIDLWKQLESIDAQLLESLIKIPCNAIAALELAKTIDQQLDNTAQLFLLDYLQYIYWQNCYDLQSRANCRDLINELERSRKYLLNYVQPRLIWESLLLTLSRKNLDKSLKSLPLI
jgi:DNA polymerase-3 subunit delta'